MSRQFRWVLLSACTALAMIFCLSFRYVRDGQELSRMQAELAESRDNWERIASEKETLQAELKALKDQLREAELSLQEETERADSIREEITALRAEIALLQQQADQLSGTASSSHS